MTEIKHTPAPWEINDVRTVEGEYMITGGEPPSFGLIATVTENADARLIAAAPDLLTACQAAVDDGVPIGRGEQSISPEAFARIVAAIAKAEGK